MVGRRKVGAGVRFRVGLRQRTQMLHPRKHTGLNWEHRLKLGAQVRIDNDFLCSFSLFLCQVFYNPSEVSFEELCGVFFGRIDPTQVNGQGGDRGTQYRTGVYPHTKEQEEMVRGLVAHPPPPPHCYCCAGLEKERLRCAGVHTSRLRSFCSFCSGIVRPPPAFMYVGYTDIYATEATYMRHESTCTRNNQLDANGSFTPTRVMIYPTK